MDTYINLIVIEKDNKRNLSKRRSVFEVRYISVGIKSRVSLNIDII